MDLILHQLLQLGLTRFVRQIPHQALATANLVAVQHTVGLDVCLLNRGQKGRALCVRHLYVLKAFYLSVDQFKGRRVEAGTRLLQLFLQR